MQQLNFSAAEINQLLGKVDAGYIDLLWTNPDPLSGFAAQNINVSVIPYRFLLVEAYVVGNSAVNQKAYIISTEVSDGNSYNSYTLQEFMNTRGSGYVTIITRVMRVNSGRQSISILDGFEKQLTSTSATTNNNMMRPYKIFGIK